MVDPETFHWCACSLITEQDASIKRGRPSQTADILIFLLHEPMEKDPLEKEGIQDVTVVNPQENEIIKAIYGSGELVDYVILKFQIRDGK